MSAIFDFFGSWSSFLALLGLVTALTILKGILSFLTSGLRAYVLPKLVGPVDPRKAYGRWALVTGCTGGIGREYARGLAAKGMDMVLVSRSKQKLDQLEKEIIERFGVNTMVIQADFTRVEVLGDIVKQVEGMEIGVLVNNVGMSGCDGGATPFIEVERKVALDLITVNMTAATILCHDLIPTMVKRGRGAVVNIGSIMGFTPGPYFALYVASKHYIHAFTEAITEECKDTGVIVQEINPALVETAMTEKLREKYGLLMMPTAQTFVSSSLATLGWTSQTAGYWSHSLELPMRLLPAWAMTIKTRISGS